MVIVININLLYCTIVSLLSIVIFFFLWVFPHRNSSQRSQIVHCFCSVPIIRNGQTTLYLVSFEQCARYTTDENGNHVHDFIVVVLFCCYSRSHV